MDKIATQNYYKSLTPKDICDCKECRNYVSQVKLSYPDLAEYLQNMGVDIEKPLETFGISSANDDYMYYIGTQYVVLGDKGDFEDKEISGAHIKIAESYPCTDIADEHFVIEIDSIRLKRII